MVSTLQRDTRVSMYYLLELEEVLRNLQTNKDEPVSRVGPFPRTDDSILSDSDVQFRQYSHSGNRRSKTWNFDGPQRSPSRSQNFDVTGVTKIHLPNSQIKLKKNEYIKYHNNTIYRANDFLEKLEPLKSGVFLKSAKSLNKREVELRDSNNLAYLLIFESHKDLKHFTENEKISNLLDNKTTIISKMLMQFLWRRSDRESLEKKGIYQNESIFGNTLRNIFVAEKGVPRFITKTLELIERPENITSLGLYRTCGNLATIQKIRLEVDKGNLDILDNFAKDPDVLTGCLKLFFRELREPLMSCQTCDNLLSIIKNDNSYSKQDKEMMRTVMSHLPEANAEIISTLIRHLVEVVKYKDQNKMDTYNLATCWGPTVIFATDSSDSVYTKDLVTQSAEATRLFDALLMYYTTYPEELDLRKRKYEHVDSNKNTIHHEDIKDSPDNTHLKVQKKYSGNGNDGVDEAVKKCVELIENADVFYKKNGSTERINKIVKKLTKKKITEMDKYKNDTYELNEALKKYLQQVHEPLVTKEAVEQVNKLCDNNNCLEHSTRLKVISVIRDLPKKETLIFLIKHFIKIIDKEASHRDSKSDVIILLQVFDETKNDVNVMAKGIPEGLLDALRNHPNMKDRIKEKTDEYENTKL
ncbi:hypothetical protein JTB14_036003 [Gonioctena quinquepunctata]|nr:hypothetical protein JTB14_036003 [Gonioctena quinquepunctata]